MTINRRTQFLNVVRMLAPDDLFIQQAAERVKEEKLPKYPGATALEFVVACQKLRDQVPTPAIKPTEPRLTRLPLQDALAIKSAEFWLKLGQADQALRELESVSRQAWNHPDAIKTRVVAVGELRMRNEAMVQE